MRNSVVLVATIGLLLAACKKDPPVEQVVSVEARSSSAPVASASSAPAEPQQLARPAEPLNVLYLSIDAMRADMPWQGYERPIAPNLTKLAEEQGVIYEDFRSVASYTAQSIATMLSGQHASTLYRNGLFFTKYHESNVWMTEAMQAKGIKTGAVQAHKYFDKGKNLEQGFDIWEVVPGITFDSETDNNVTSPKAFEMIKEILSDPDFTKGQFFFWSHLTDPHDQYIGHELCPEEWRKGKNRDRYDCEIYFVDHYLGQFLQWAQKQSWWKKTALIVSADHGEVFGEHGQYKHAFRIWDALVKVPAIFVVPGAKPHRIKARRTHIDLAPTVMDLMGLEPLPNSEGKTMVPEIFGAEPDNREPIVLELTEDSNNPHYRAIIQGDYKLIVEGGGWGYELYNIREDPGETKDLARSNAAKFEEMKKLFKSTFDKIPSVEPYGGNKLHSGRIARGPMGPAQDIKRKEREAKQNAP